MHARLRRWRGGVALVAAMLLSGCGYNAIQQKDEAVKAGWSEVLNQYQRRADLVPNLVNTVKGYAAHESQVLTEVTEARARVGQVQVNADDAASLQQFQAAQGGLNSALAKLMVVVEQYPDLKANANMAQLTEELTSTENKISFARQAYNDSVMVYNTARETFPNNFISGMFNFAAAELFQVENAAERQAPQVKFTS